VAGWPERAGAGELDHPLLGLAEAPPGAVADQATGRNEQVGRAAEAVAADERQLGQHVGGVPTEPAGDQCALVEQVPVHPVGHLLELGHERGQRLRRVRYGGDPARERRSELLHRHPPRRPRSHPDRVRERRAELVTLPERAADPVHQVLVDGLDATQQLERRAEAHSTRLRLPEPGGIGTDGDGF
jgi:hypothetical protein